MPDWKEEDTGEGHDCPTCYGEGEIRKWHLEGEDFIECRECGGTGREPYRESER